MFTHKGTKVLETDRLVLRPFRLEDARAMFDRWASDPQVTRYMTWPTHESLETSKAVLADWTANYARADYYEWAIVRKELDEFPIGSIGAFSFKEGADQAEVGYCLSRDHWGQGLMPEALGAVLGFLFEEVGCNRIIALHAVDNPKSGRVMAKVGMQLEGTLRQAVVSNDGRSDCKLYGILRSDPRA